MAATTRYLSDCAGKVRHRDPREAERSRAVIRRRKDVRLVPYRCRHCGCWHLGTAWKSGGDD